MLTVARGHPDVPGVGVDVERGAHEPLVADHVAAVGVDLHVALRKERHWSGKSTMNFKFRCGYLQFSLPAQFYLYLFVSWIRTRQPRPKAPP